MLVRANATKLKWLCFLILLAINISVLCIWVPARLQISEQFIAINNIWDRVEKVIFAIMDAILNFYFIWVVKKRLIANGLHKYNRLYQMNLFLVAISIALDVSPQRTRSRKPRFLLLTSDVDSPHLHDVSAQQLRVSSFQCGLLCVHSHSHVRTAMSSSTRSSTSSSSTLR